MHKLSDARPSADCIQVTTGPPTCTATHRRSPSEARARPGGDLLLRMAVAAEPEDSEPEYTGIITPLLLVLLCSTSILSL